MTRRLAVAALLFGFHAVTACGDASDPTRCEPRCGREQAVITSYSAEREVVTLGDATFITAVFPEGHAIIDKLGTVTSGTRIATGALMETTTFVLTVTDTSGRRATSKLTVRVVDPPRITRFASDQALATQNTPIVLTGVFTGGIATITSPLGARVDDVRSGEPVVVNVPATTSFALVVTNPAGDSASMEVLVVAYPRPTITRFAASHEPFVTAGRTTSVTAEFEGGDAVVMPDGIVVRSGVPFSTAIIDAVTTLLLTVTNDAGGTSSAELTLVPVPEPTVVSVSANIPDRGAHGLLDVTFIGESVRVEERDIVATRNGIIDVGAIDSRTTLVLTVVNAAGDIASMPVTIYPVEGRTCLSVAAANPTAPLGTIAIKPAATPRVVQCDGPWMVALTSESGRWTPTRDAVTGDDDDFFKLADQAVNELGDDRLHRFSSRLPHPQEELRADDPEGVLYVGAHGEWDDTEPDMGLMTGSPFWGAVARSPDEALRNGFSALREQEWFATQAWGITPDDCSAYTLIASARSFMTGVTCDPLLRHRIELSIAARETFAQVVVNAQPEALFRFEPFEGLHRLQSSAGSMHTVTLHAGADSAIGLNPGESLRFDGVSGRATIPFSPALNTAASTITFWVAATDRGSTRQTIISAWDAGRGYVIALDVSLHLEATVGAVTLTDPEPLVAERATLVSLAVADGVARLYRDSVEVAQGPVPTWQPNAIADISVGSDASSLTPFAGRLDDLAFFPEAKSVSVLREMVLAGGL